jgi:hypothetical protein
MHVVLPKVRKSDGKLVVTSIMASQMVGIEPRVVKVNGQNVQGCKVYASYGSFYVPCHPLIVMQGQANAIESKQPVMISKGTVNALNGYVLNQLSYANPKHAALITAGGK